MPQTILVIEDEQAIAAAVAARLEKEGFDVLVAADGVSGIETSLGQPQQGEARLRLPSPPARQPVGLLDVVQLRLQATQAVLSRGRGTGPEGQRAHALRQELAEGRDDEIERTAR